MVITFRYLLLLFGLCGAVAVEASPKASPAVDVIVTKGESTAVAYRGKTDALGNFATGNLQPGAYVVQFTSQKLAALKGRELSIDVAADKRRVKADAVPAEKFGGAGVAMKVNVARATKLSGQVASAEIIAASARAAAEKARAANVKMLNGKPHIWVPGGIETRMGGRWVEEGSDAARVQTIGGSRNGDVSRSMHGAQGPGDAAVISGGTLEIMDKTGSLNPNPQMARAPTSGK